MIPIFGLPATVYAMPDQKFAYFLPSNARFCPKLPFLTRYLPLFTPWILTLCGIYVTLL